VLRPGRAGLSVGATLDLVSLNAQDPALAAHQGDEILDSWIFCGGRSLVDCVWRAGTRLVSGGVHRDREALRARYAKALQRLVS
jgi:formimidoylglutamate deiminase